MGPTWLASGRGTTAGSKDRAVAHVHDRRHAARHRHRQRSRRWLLLSESNATWSFSADEPGSTFQCRVYQAALLRRRRSAPAPTPAATLRRASRQAPTRSRWLRPTPTATLTQPRQAHLRHHRAACRRWGRDGRCRGHRRGADAVDSGLTLSIARQRLGALLSRGLKVGASCSEPASLRIQLVAPGGSPRGSSSTAGLVRRCWRRSPRARVAGRSRQAQLEGQAGAQGSALREAAGRGLATDAAGNASAPVTRGATLKR